MHRKFQRQLIREPPVASTQSQNVSPGSGPERRNLCHTSLQFPGYGTMHRPCLCSCMASALVGAHWTICCDAGNTARREPTVPGNLKQSAKSQKEIIYKSVYRTSLQVIQLKWGISRIWRQSFLNLKCLSSFYYLFLILLLYLEIVGTDALYPSITHLTFFVAIPWVTFRQLPFSPKYELTGLTMICCLLDQFDI